MSKFLIPSVVMSGTSPGMTGKEKQISICKMYGSIHFPSPNNLKLGISENVRSGLMPINGLRHQPEQGTTGWFIWAGKEFSSEPNFFVPLHTKHVDEWSKLITPYLGLAPGWRFLVTNEHVDVWFDEKLLESST